MDHSLVAWDGPGRDDHPVPGADVHHRVALRRESCERRHRLSLASRSQQQEPRRGDPIRFLEWDRQAFRNLQESQLARGREVLLKTSAHHSHAPVELDRHAHEVLDAVDVGSEVGDDDPPWSLTKDALERGVQVTFRAGAAAALGVRRVAQQQQHAFIADAPESLHVGRMAVGWRVVELEVAGVDDPSHGRLDGETDRVRDGVADGNRLDPEWAELHRVAHTHLAKIGLTQHAVLPEFRLEEAEREAGAEDGGVQLFQGVGQPADVVLVAVREEDAHDLLALAQ